MGSGKSTKRLGAVTYLVQEGQRQSTVHVDHMLPWRGNRATLPPTLPVPVTTENVPQVAMDNVSPAVLPSTPQRATQTASRKPTWSGC